MTLFKMFNPIRLIKNLFHKALKEYFVLKITLCRDITFGIGLKLSGIPIFDIRNGGCIVLGDNVTLTSCNDGYHLNLFGPVKLLADRPSAKVEIGDETRIHGSCFARI